MAFSREEFKSGAKDSVPICLGYFGVSFALGITAREAGISAPLSALMSFTNLASAGQFALINLIRDQASYILTFFTIFVINLRYGLMSLTLTQKLPPKTGTLKRMLIAYGNTDEIFAVSSSRGKLLTGSYMAGLEIFPILSWTAGTFIGAISGNILPAAVLSALGIALYAMFISIVTPPASTHRGTAFVIFISIALSLLFHYTPILPISPREKEGIIVIICTLAAAVIGAAFFPTPEEKKEVQS